MHWSLVCRFYAIEGSQKQIIRSQPGSYIVAPASVFLPRPRQRKGRSATGARQGTEWFSSLPSCRKYSPWKVTWKWSSPTVCSGFHGLPFGAILHFHVSSRECIYSILLNKTRGQVTQTSRASLVLCSVTSPWMCSEMYYVRTAQQRRTTYA